MWETIHTEGIWYGEITNKRKNAELFVALQSISAVKDDKGEISGYVSVFSDITERKNNEIELEHLATHDTLTSLPNRIYFHNSLDKSIHTARRNNKKIGVLFLDLNRFKEVNDTMGHKIGDVLLQNVAIRLLESIREEDTVARLGGDEFAIILSELVSNEDTTTIAQKIIDNISQPLAIETHRLIPSTSIGISIYPDHAQDGDTLLKLADMAMYLAKQNKEFKYELYDPTKSYT